MIKAFASQTFKRDDLSGEPVQLTYTIAFHEFRPLEVNMLFHETAMPKSLEATRQVSLQLLAAIKRWTDDETHRKDHKAAEAQVKDAEGQAPDQWLRQGQGG